MRREGGPLLLGNGASTTGSAPGCDDALVAANELWITLDGTAAPPGQVELVDLAAMGSALQELSTRVGREWVDRSGPGRTTHAVSQMTRLRLTGLGVSETVLRLEYGSTELLPFDETPDDQVANLFWEVLEGIAAGDRPGWVTGLVAASAASLNRAFERAATRVSIESDGRPGISWRPADFRRSVWLAADRSPVLTVAITGRLDAVDLETGSFRITDDSGVQVSLEHVVDPRTAAHLIGERVLVTGAGQTDRHGHVRHLDAATIEGPLLPDPA